MRRDRYTEAAAAFRGLTYDDIVCSVLTARLLERALGWARDKAWFDAMQIRDPADLWSPITATAERLGSEPVLPWGGPNRPLPGRAHLWQGWRTNGRGHQGLWIGHPVDPWQGWVLHSTELGHMGPAVWGITGNVPLADALSPEGDALAIPGALDFGVLLDRYDAGLAWQELPA